MTGLELPDDYATVLADLKQRVRQARYQAQRRVNTELISLYWQIGRVLLDQTEQSSWGEKLIAQLSADLRAEFAGSSGVSPRNLVYMRSFARAARLRPNRATACCADRDHFGGRGMDAGAAPCSMRASERA